MRHRLDRRHLRPPPEPARDRETGDREQGGPRASQPGLTPGAGAGGGHRERRRRRLSGSARRLSAVFPAAGHGEPCPAWKLDLDRRGLRLAGGRQRVDNGLQRRGEVARRGGPLPGLLGEGAGQERCQRGRNRRLGRKLRRPGQDGLQQQRQARGDERLPPVDQLEQDGARRVQIGRRCRILAAQHLGRQVGRRAQDEPLRGVERVARETPRDAEIGDPGDPVGRQEQVLWLEVTVDDAFLVGGLQPVEHRRHQAQRLRQARRRVFENLAQRGPLDQFVHDVRAFARYSQVVDPNDCRMRQGRRQPGLPAEPGQHLGFPREPLAKELGGGPPVQLAVPDLEDESDTAFAQSPEHLVTGEELGGQCLWSEIHHLECERGASCDTWRARVAWGGLARGSHAPSCLARRPESKGTDPLNLRDPRQEVYRRRERDSHVAGGTFVWRPRRGRRPGGTGTGIGVASTRE